MAASKEIFSNQFFRRLQCLKIHTRRSFLGSRQGSHTSLRRGHGLEFSDFRPYAFGDDFRHIDWSAYGKTDRFFVRQFREEQDLNVLCLLDTSASMGYPQESGKFEMAKRLALALGYIALTDGDSVSFSFLGQRLTPRFRGPKALGRAINEFNELEPGGAFSLPKEVMATLAYMKIPGKCFLISDCMLELGDIYQSIDYIKSRNFELSLIQVLSSQELRFSYAPGSYTLRDVETEENMEISLGVESQIEYSRMLAEHVSQIEQFCRQSEVAHLIISSEEDFSDIMFRRFPDAGLLK